jgi:hypothetical protein
MMKLSNCANILPDSYCLLNKKDLEQTRAREISRLMEQRRLALKAHRK